MPAVLRHGAFVARAFPVAALVVSGCATRGTAPADVATLEATLRADSASVPARLRLAAAYARGGEAGRAVPLLEPIVRADSSDAAASLYLGMGYEAQERYAEARRLYERFVEGPAPADLKRRIEDRLVLLSRLELRSAVRASIAQERALAEVAPSPLTVGVFPFTVSGDTALRPLGRAMAELLTTDLGQTSRLRVVERARVQMLLDEMELGASRYADPSTAARAGRVVGAGNLVQGALEGGEADLSVRAVVVATTRPDSTAEPVRGEGGIARLIDMEKTIALEVYDRLGIQLTAAERQRVNRRPTENVQALLAFGFGLEARDAGRYSEAARHFARARQLDPGFQQAAQLGSETQREAQASSFTTQQVAQQAADDFDLGLTSFQREQLDIDVLESLIPTPLVRDPSVEVLGAEGLGRGTVIDIIIRRPGGGD